MEWKDTRQSILTTRTICDETEERAVDLDIVLPDYYAPIAAIVKCTMNPVITSCGNVGGRYTVDGIAKLRMLYVSDDRKQMYCYEHNQPFSVTFHAEDAVHHDVSVYVDYVNCRASAPRRADIHGAFRVQLKAVGCCGVDMFAPPQDQTVFCRTTMLERSIPTQEVYKSFSVEDAVDLGVNVDKVIYSDVEVAFYECKALMNKAIVKGVLLARSVCLIGDRYSVMSQEIPFSQIVDVNGLCDDWQCESIVNVGEWECRLQQSENGGALLMINARLLACVRCSTSMTDYLVLDAYSTKEEILCETTLLHTRMSTVHHPIKLSIHQHISIPEHSVDILDVCGSVRSKNVSVENGNVILSCCVLVSMITSDSEGEVHHCERAVDIVHNLDVAYSDAAVRCVRVQPSLNSDQIGLQIELLVTPYAHKENTIEAVSNVVLNNNSSFAKSPAAIRIVYAERGDSLWDIAKMHHASVDDIVAENDVHDEVLLAPTMLMIPMT